MKTIDTILKAISYILGIAGVLCIIGTAGALEQDNISIPQFLTQEFCGFVMCFITYGIYRFRMYLLNVEFVEYDEDSIFDEEF
jgi:hypothetical protein